MSRVTIFPVHRQPLRSESNPSFDDIYEGGFPHSDVEDKYEPESGLQIGALFIANSIAFLSIGIAIGLWLAGAR